MFKQLPEWHSKISLRGAMFNAIGFGFVAGTTFGILILSVFRLHVANLEIGMFLFYLVLSLALVVRFYFLAISRVRAQHSSRA
jgi:hypothetical protein